MRQLNALSGGEPLPDYTMDTPRESQCQIAVRCKFVVAPSTNLAINLILHYPSVLTISDSDAVVQVV